MKYRKILAPVLAGALCLGVLTACVDSPSDVSDSPPPTVSVSPTPENTEPPAPTTGHEAAGTFRIGAVGPLTGGAAVYGSAVKAGAEIAVEEINALNGIQLELCFEDDANDPEKSVSAYRSLKEWGMQVFLGSVTSGPCAAAAAESDADSIFCLTPSASSTDVTGGAADPQTGAVEIQRRSSVFRMCPSDPEQAVYSAQYISDKKLGQKVAVIYQVDDVYSAGLYRSFSAKAAELKLDVVSITTFTTDSVSDFSVQIADAKNNGADLVYLPVYRDAAARILTEAAASDYAPTFFGTDGMDGILTAKRFDPGLAEGVMLLTTFDAGAEDERTQAFVSKYQEAYDELPNQFAADAYDCVYAVYSALVASGADGDMSAGELCRLLVGQFTSDSFRFTGLTGTDMAWSADGAVSREPKCVTIRDGAYVDG